MLRALWLSCLVFTSGAALAQQSLRTVELRAGMYRIEAEVASTEKQHEIGLMHRASMPAHAGMLFVFDQAQEYCFWMKNTQIPLSIAFLDEAGKIVNIADMQPQSEENHCAAKPVRYALEMNQGWFRSKGIKAGSSIQGIK
ncbi:MULTISPECIES: DUF192 domain-containing protein [Uliginosibacterium]|uniref:DUF192 domain-containing protein n=1 Tax=Uliginosibacterium aquaticum TaxID=2731212 RepID=A0ABX2IHL6_9RHOO|nr:MULTISPECIES: DUF192 domain-containing protein [Uliginosibacterium]MDO6387602.1 DUF192 domain-containing protein [Uliginosibacterium sp. 31-12]NSL56240.1 DUF192 domain-containing protein [Uliginosibacterium aquaticum]PLK47924.1 hypothetical protein C0V76_14210 [Uliginosibacterium sp. TH139]